MASGTWYVVETVTVAIFAAVVVLLAVWWLRGPEGFAVRRRRDKARSRLSRMPLQRPPD
jgi:hypothetical protein